MALLGDTLNNASKGAPPVVKFCFFVAVLSTMLSICRFALSYTGIDLHKKLSLMALLGDTVATFFIFIGAITLVCMLGVHSCFNEVINLSFHLQHPNLRL